MGHYFPRPHVPRFHGYVFKFSTDGGDAQGSRRRYSDGHPGELLGEFAEFGGRHVPFLYYEHLTLTGPQRSPHLHDRRPARPVQQERPCCDGVFSQNQWAVQVHRYHTRRVFCPVHCELGAGHWIVGCPKPVRKCLHAYPG